MSWIELFPAGIYLVVGICCSSISIVVLFSGALLTGRLAVISRGRYVMGVDMLCSVCQDMLCSVCHSSRNILCLEYC